MARSTAGKKIDTWKYTAANGEKREIPVVMRPRAEDRSTFEFCVHLKEFNILDSDVDINKLKKRVFDAIAGKDTIDWKPYLVIQVDEYDSPCDLGGDPGKFTPNATAKVAVGSFLYGVRDGIEYRKVGGRVIQRGLTTFHENGAVTFIPDTPEARKAINTIIEAIAGVNRQLETMLSAENIDKTIVEVNEHGFGVIALPGGG